MAENKKSFVLYTDSQGLVNQLPDDVAGRLLKHIYAYVNDENPVSDELLLNIAFEPIKMQLKRDLIKWEQTKDGRSAAGKASAEARRLAKLNQQNSTNSTNVNFVQQSSTNSTVNDNVNVNVINKEEAVDNYRHTSFKNQCLNDQQWKEAIFMQKILKPETIEFALKDYNIHLIQQSEIKHSLKDYKSHFVNWVKKKKELASKTENKDRL